MTENTSISKLKQGLLTMYNGIIDDPAIPNTILINFRAFINMNFKVNIKDRLEERRDRAKLKMKPVQPMEARRPRWDGQPLHVDTPLKDSLTNVR